MEIKIITGMSGAGKTTMIKYFEDLGYNCHDNFPSKLIIPYIKEKEFNKIVFVVDSRTEKNFFVLENIIEELKKCKIIFSLIYLECNDDELINRYKEENRLHHFQTKYELTLLEAIQKERILVENIKNKSDYIFDTSNLSNNEFLKKIETVFENKSSENKLAISCISFGYKHGVPKGIDILYDVRCFKNPYWIPELRDKTGLDKEVEEYIMKFENSQIFIEKIYDIVDFIIPIYIQEGKRQLNIAFGCTGGHHRSVCFAQQLYSYLQDKKYNVIVKHINIKD